MNTKFEEFKELTNYDMIDTYYDEIKDFKYFISDLQEDRVESQKYIVNANEEIKRLNTIINEYDEKTQMLDSVCRSLEFSAPENDYIFKERLREIIDELKELKGSDKE